MVLKKTVVVTSLGEYRNGSLIEMAIAQFLNNQDAEICLMGLGFWFKNVLVSLCSLGT